MLVEIDKVFFESVSGLRYQDHINLNCRVFSNMPFLQRKNWRCPILLSLEIIVELNPSRVVALRAL